jgi:carboxypeptidase Taq
MGKAIAKFRELLGQVSDLQAASSLMGWDQQTYMPPGGAEARAQQLATVERMAHELYVSDDFGEALDKAAKEAASLDPDSDDARLVKEIRRDRDKRCKVPAEWVAEANRARAIGFAEWEKAKKASDFPRFAPFLEKILALTRQYVEFFAPYDHVYDPLLDDFEPGMKTEEVRQVFEALRPRQVALVQDIVERGAPVDDSILYEHYDEQKQWEFGLHLVRELGYDFERGRQDKSTHPFTTEFSINDVRITTRIKPNLLPSAIFSSVHETGHALYGQGVSMTLERTPLCGGASHGFHESQSRLMENLVGRSKPFWRRYYPRLQETFPQQLGKMDWEDFYRAINKVQPSLIRVEADEATYNLHIMMRFELELALMEGRLQVPDLPQAWNEKTQEYLGLVPPDDAQGVLQDVHWSGGAIGYFPSYALGNLIACQLWELIKRDIPELEAQIEAGDFQTLLAWLREKVHRHGGKFQPAELLQRITGGGLSADPYMRYLQEKFADIYKL